MCLVPPQAQVRRAAHDVGWIRVLQCGRPGLIKLHIAPAAAAAKNNQQPTMVRVVSEEAGKIWIHVMVRQSDGVTPTPPPQPHGWADGWMNLCDATTKTTTNIHTIRTLH